MEHRERSHQHAAALCGRAAIKATVRFSVALAWRLFLDLCLSSETLPRLLRRRLALRIGCGLLTAFVGLAAVAICIWLLVESRNYSGVLAIAGTFAAAAVLISASEIFQHYVNYTRPALQKQVVRVLLMVPIYALASFTSLAFPILGPYVDVVRELYEALTIYAFTWFVLTWLEMDANLSFASYPELLASKQPLPHIWPMNFCLPPWPMGTPFIRSVQAGVLNYVVVRPITALLGFVLTPLHLYSPGDFSPQKAYVYLATLNSLSQGWALYCLVMLYRVAWRDLAGIKVLAKFLCVKGVVFATYWQGIAVAAGIKAGVVQQVLHPREDNPAFLATRIQNFVICCEMLFFALAHSYAFSAREFWSDGAQQGAPRSVWANLATVFDWSDVGHNMVGQVHFGADTLVDGVQNAGSAVLGTVFLAPLQKMRQFRKTRRAQRAADGAEADDEEEEQERRHSWGGTPAPTAPQRPRGVRQTLLPPGATDSAATALVSADNHS